MSEVIETLLEELNPSQYQAVTSKANRLLILAGAGSGKTRVLIQRIAWLIGVQQISPHRILAVTFTNKAAQEMRHRLEKVLPGKISQTWVGTFHGLSHRILRQHALEANLVDNFQIIDSDDQLRIIKRMIKERGWDEEFCEPKRVMGFINQQKDMGKRANHVNTHSQDTARFLEIYRYYEQYCQRSGSVDFAEIILRTYELWISHPEVLRKYQERFSYILVDEFQDTNTIQYAWLKLLYHTDGQLMIVGDDDQSIYGWRGAKIENLHRLDREFRDVVTIRLEQNYRSTSTILAAANALIANNEERLGKELWTQGIPGEKISLYGAFNELDEARFIIARIQDWVGRGGNYDDVGILYRSNAQSRVLEQALRSVNIPYRIYGGLRFFERAEIKDILAYLRVALNSFDDSAFERVVNLPPRGVGEKTLEQIRENAKAQNESLWHALLSYGDQLPFGRASTGIRQFVLCIQDIHAQLKTLNLPQLIDYVISRSGLLAYMKGQVNERTQARIENAFELVQAAVQFEQVIQEKNPTQQLSLYTLPLFLSEVALDSTNDEEHLEQSVKLMTLHSAKGLEFPLVFLAGMEDGLFPHQRCIQEKSLLEEERRLCYVGITRAMSKLYITYAEKRAFAGTTGRTRPSRFIKEIPMELLSGANFSAHDTIQPMTLKSHVDSPFKIGQRVKHARFGEGIVTNIDGLNEKARVEVNFSEGKKWLVIIYANLIPLTHS